MKAVNNRCLKRGAINQNTVFTLINAVDYMKLKTGIEAVGT